MAIHSTAIESTPAQVTTRPMSQAYLHSKAYSALSLFLTYGLRQAFGFPFVASELRTEPLDLRDVFRVILIFVISLAGRSYFGH